MRGGGSLWDHDLVSSVAFHPRRCAPNSRRPRWIDDTLEVSSGGGAKLAYRLYTAPPADGLGGERRSAVLVYFHANAELCTDLETEVDQFHKLGFQAVLAPEFRGYAWGTGKPKLGLLKGDAAAFMAALPEILQRAEFPNPERVNVLVHGRSLGAICAVHAAAACGDRVSGLLVESGCLSIQDLPMFVELGRMMPDMYRMLAAQPDPVGTLAQMQEVAAPTLIIHGDRDEVVPVQQAVKAHQSCGSGAKKLVRYARGSHNDIRVNFGNTYFQEVRKLLEVVEGSLHPEEWTRAPPPAPSVFVSLASALRCLPGMRRCIVNERAEGQQSEMPAD